MTDRYIQYRYFSDSVTCMGQYTLEVQPVREVVFA